MMHKNVARLFARIRDGDNRTRRRCDCARVANLSAGLAIKRRLVDDDRYVRTRLGIRDARTAAHNRRDLAFRFFGAIAQKIRRADFIGNLEPDFRRAHVARTRPTFSCFRFLLGHRGFKARDIDRLAASA